MDPFSLSLVLMLNAMNSIAVAIVFIHFWWLDRRNTAAIYWASGFALLGVRQSILAVILGASPPPIVALVAELFLPTLQFAFVGGTYLLTDRPIPYRKLWLAFGGLGAAIVAAYAAGVPDVIFRGIGTWGSFVAAAMVGRAFVVYGRQHPRVGHGVIGYLFYGWAIAILLANTARSIPGVLPAYYLIQPVLTIAVGLALIITIQRRQQAAMAIAEEGVRTNEARLARIVAALDLSGHGLVLEGADGKIIYANATAGKLLGNRASVLEFMEKAGLAAHIRESGSWSGAVTQSRSDGHDATLSVRTERLPDGGLVTLLEDQTERKATEEKLRQSQKMEAVGQLAGGIAHDFNNILGIILGFAGFLQQDLLKGTPEQEFVERILAAGLRGKDLVGQILAFSRRSGVECKPTDLAPLLRETHGLLRGSLPSSTRLEVTGNAEGLIANVNAAQINQILLNLCLNANDALQGAPGSVSVSLDRVDAGAPELAQLTASPGARSGKADGEFGHVMGVLRPQRNYACITVADTGVGIAPELIARIFEPFFTSKGLGRGTGLGLSVVHGIVMDYEGALFVTSRPGGGSVFRVYLPLVDTTAKTTVENATRAPAVRGRERVLVVDDEVTMADVLVTGLARLGYQTKALNDPADAIKVVGENPAAWDVVISDHVMPGMKGLTLLKRLKEIRPALHVILCTGFSEDATEEVALTAGVDAFFMKPVSPEQLATAIRRIVDPSAGAEDDPPAAFTKVAVQTGAPDAA